MKPNRLTLLMAGVGVLFTVTISYATCFAVFSDSLCVQAGNCYGQCTPAGCSQNTCIIATQAGYEYGTSNVYPAGDGTYQNRMDSGIKNMCYVSGCKVWNNCTQSYEYSPVNGCSCNAPVTKWLPRPPACL